MPCFQTNPTLKQLLLLLGFSHQRSDNHAEDKGNDDGMREHTLVVNLGDMALAHFGSVVLHDLHDPLDSTLLDSSHAYFAKTIRA